MYVPKPDFFRTPPPSQQVWRYTELSKFISLLERRALFFASAAKMDDPYEGRQSEAAMRQLLEFFEHPSLKGYWETQRLSPRKLVHSLGLADADNTADVGINCWHCNSGESAAMWELYGSRHAGVAIQSTFGRLCESFDASEGEVLAGLVIYGDDNIHPGTLGPIVHKRQSFEHENELRAIVYPLSKIWERTGESKTLCGTYVPVDLDRLIERVMVAPLAPSYFLEATRAVAARYGLNPPIEQSALYQGPLY
jgi:hypothetical protein